MKWVNLLRKTLIVKLSILLCIVLCVCMIPAAAFADEAEELTEEITADEVTAEAVEEPEEEATVTEEAEVPVEDETETAEEEAIVPQIFAEDVILEENMTVEEDEIVIFKGGVVIPEGISLVNYGELSIEGKAEIAGVLCNEKGAVITVTAAGDVTFLADEDNAAELENHGSFYVYGAVTLQKGVVFADTNNPLRCLGLGTVKGTYHYIAADGSIPEEIIPITAAEFETMCARGEFEDEVKYELTESVEISADSVLMFNSGRVNIPEGLELCVKGAMFLDGGIVTFEKGAKLVNDMFICVEGEGQLVVDAGAEYIPAENSAIIWDQSGEGNPLVSGIARDGIECSVYADTAAAFAQAVRTTGYRMLTVYIDDPDFVTAVKEIPDGVAVCMR